MQHSDSVHLTITHRYHIARNKKEHPNIFVVPCYDNHLIWHTHQQDALAYQADTSSILGKMLDHNDTKVIEAQDQNLKMAVQQQQKIWKEKGLEFPGAMYRGESPLLRIEPDQSRFISPNDKVS